MTVVELPLTFTACCRPSKLKPFPAGPHYKFIFIIGEANTMQAGSKPRVVRRRSVATTPWKEYNQKYQ